MKYKCTVSDAVHGGVIEITVDNCDSEKQAKAEMEADGYKVWSVSELV